MTTTTLQWRYDRATVRFDKASITTDERGYLYVWGTVVPADSMLDYTRADGRPGSVTEFVPRSTVSDPKAVASMLHAPITFHHPPEMLTTENTSAFQVGTVVESKFDVAADAHLVRHQFTSARVIKKIQDGEIRELSPGYTTQIVDSPGAHGGKRFDAIQTHRRYNHQALVPEARAGHQNRLSLDSLRRDLGEASLQIQIIPEELMADINDKTTEPAKGTQPTQDAHDPKDFELNSDAGDNPFAKKKKGEEDKDKEDKGKKDATASPTGDSTPAPAPTIDYARLATMVADTLDTRQASRDSADTKRSELIASVKDVLPESYKFDGKPVDEITFDAIARANPDFKVRAKAVFDAKGSERLAGMLDIALASATTRNDSAPSDSRQTVDGKVKSPVQLATARGKARRDQLAKLATQGILGTAAYTHDSVSKAVEAVN